MRPVKNYLLETRIIHGRIVLIMILVALLTLVLLVRLVNLQLFQHDRYAKLAQNNRINIEPLPPVRGLIYDRNGVVLAENFRVYNLEINPSLVENMSSLVENIGQIIDLSDNDIKRFNRLLKSRTSFERQTLKTNLSELEASLLAVNQHFLKGVQIQARLQRFYPQRELTGHVVGYVGRISEQDLDKVDRNQYRGLEYIGKNGVEAYYENSLRGQVGFEEVETNAHGRVIRSLGHTPPQSGNNLHLSLDIALQKKTYDTLKDHIGAVVAIEPQTGDILSFVSTPGYDPNIFVNAISHTDYQALSLSSQKPLLNRALYGRYVPGSTIKGFMALVGFENGVKFDHTVFCPGWFSLPNSHHRYRCWKRSGHGNVNASSAIEQSCDVYFYDLAHNLGIDRIYEGMRKFGFGHQTGIDLLQEPSGLVPSPKWKQDTLNQSWYPGETVITGIGQGYMLTTPLQLANAMATLANRGKIMKPHLLIAIENPQNQIRTPTKPVVNSVVKLKNKKYYEHVIDSMSKVVHSSRGTARRISANIGYKMAGKTGTSQVKSIAQGMYYDESDVEKKYRDHSLFVAFAPIKNPKIAIAVVIEHGGSGSLTAAPIARKIVDFYLLGRLGMSGSAG